MGSRGGAVRAQPYTQPPPVHKEQEQGLEVVSLEHSRTATDGESLTATGLRKLLRDRRGSPRRPLFVVLHQRLDAASQGSAGIDCT